jgi:L-fucose isomerase-like protein
VFLTKGEVIPMEKELRGTYMRVRFDKPVREVLGNILDNGIAHHASVVYGNYLEPFRILARIQGWKVIE